MGCDKVLSLGGFKGWVDAGGEAEKGDPELIVDGPGA
jgi:hypothetical protein